MAKKQYSMMLRPEIMASVVAECERRKITKSVWLEELILAAHLPDAVPPCSHEDGWWLTPHLWWCVEEQRKIRRSM